jgi:glutamine synthetase
MSTIYPPEYQQSPPPAPEPEKRIARFRNAAIAGVLLILVGASVFSLVKLSSVQASLSHAQKQAAAAESQVSALQSEVAADQGELNTAQSDITTLQGTVDGLSSLSVYTSKVCNNNDVYNDNTKQYITAYYPCTGDNPNG